MITERSPKNDFMPEEKRVRHASIYPNPAYAGCLVTVLLPGEDFFPDTVQMFSPGGFLVHTLHQDATDDASVFNLHLPSQLNAGMYVLRMTVTGRQLVMSAKLLVK